jgi:uncharacterized protein (DUF1501 family)
VLDLYRHVDPKLGDALEAGIEARDMAGVDAEKEGAQTPGMAGMQGVAAGTRTMIETATGAARLLAGENGPRLAALSYNGWDTHAREGGAEGRLATLLGSLDQAIAAMKATLGPAWRETVVLIITEFGRTAHVNGTLGTDHGTATVAFLAGGAVRGGQVIADWPGLGSSQLYEGRDLKPTLDLRSVFKGVAMDHLGVPEKVLSTEVFPGTERVAAQKDLVKA